MGKSVQQSSSSLSWGWSRLLVGWVTLLVIGTDLFVVSPLLPLIARAYSITPSTAGWAVASFSVAYAVGSPFFGALATRWGRRPSIVAGLVCFAGANIFTGLAPSFAWLVAVRFLAGLTAAAVTPSVYAISRETTAAERRGTAIAFVGSGLLIALATGAPSGSALADVAGWRGVFFLLAGAIAILALANRIAWPVPERPRNINEDTNEGFVAILGAVFAGTSPVAVLRAVLATVVWGTALYGFYTYLGAGFRSGLGSSSDVPLIAALVIYGAGAALGSNIGGMLSDRYGARRVATLSMACIGVALLLIGVLLTGNILLLVVFGVYALVGYAFFPAHQSRLAEAFPDHSTTFLAWNNSALYTGITLGSAVGGVVLSVLSFGVLPYVCAAVAMFGIAVSAWSLQGGKQK